MGQTQDSAAAPFSTRWEQLFEAALLEDNPALIVQRIRDAKEAIMDHIEDSFDTASLSERQSLLAALNVLGELRRLSGVNDVRQPMHLPGPGHWA